MIQRFPCAGGDLASAIGADLTCNLRLTVKELCISKIYQFELCYHTLLSRCPESLVVQGVAKSRVIVETGVQTVGGVGGEGGQGEGGYGQGDREGEEEGERKPNGLKEYILSHREEVTTFHPNLLFIRFESDHCAALSVTQKIHLL